MDGKDIPTGYYESFESAFGHIQKTLDKLEKQQEDNHKESVYEIKVLIAEISTLKIDLMLVKRHSEDKISHCKMDVNNDISCFASEELAEHKAAHIKAEEKAVVDAEKRKTAKWKWAAVIVPAMTVVSYLSTWIVSGVKALAAWVFSIAQNPTPPGS